jgi:hypothetical protein
MGIFLKVLGVIGIVLGVIFTLTVLGAPIGISMIVGGVQLFALGAVYDSVNEIKARVVASGAGGPGAGAPPQP